MRATMNMHRGQSFFNLWRVATLLPVAAITTCAQDFAPSSFANSMLTVTVTAGRTPFAASGSYRFFTSVAGSNYVVLGPGPLTSGTYSYAKIRTGVSRAVLTDAASGQAATLQLTFASQTDGTLALTNASGFQTGSFTAASYADTSPPELFLPGVATGLFQSYLSGRSGLVYALETSSNLTHWLPWQTVLVPDLTVGFGEAVGGGSHFYRAWISSSAFAPASLTNKTLNLTIAAGAPPLSTNGICQWMGGTNDLSYQLVAGPGTSGGSGTYHYTTADANRGLVAYTEAGGGGQFNALLVFNSLGSGYFYLTNATSPGYEAGTFTLADGAVDFLGNVKFTPETARARSLAFPANGSVGNLSVTNAAGWVWSLTIPGNALTELQTITMTPFSKADSSQSLLPITNGVVLEPDGLQFCDGVTLTVVPPAPLGAHAALLMAGDDGSDLCYFETASQSASLSATLLHFTSGGVTDPSDSQWTAYVQSHLPKAQAAYAQATNDVQSLLPRATNQPPPPPNYIWRCTMNDPVAIQQIDAYLGRIFTNETAAIKRLRSAAMQLAALGQDPGSATTNLVKRLIETDEFGQVNNLMACYYTTNVAELDSTLDPNGNSEKFMALYKLTSSVNAMDKAYGGKGNTNWPTLLKNWSKAIRDGCIRQVHDDHYYTMAQTAQTIETFRNTVMNVAPDPKGTFVQKMAKALMFSLTLDMNFTFTDWDSDGQTDDKVTEEATGTVNLQAGITPPFPVLSTNLSFQSGSWADYQSDCSYALDPGQSNAWNLAVGLLACGSTPQVYVILNGPYLFEETWTGCHEVSMPSPWLGVLYGTAFVCASGGANGSGGLFHFPLQDGQADLINQTVQGDSQSGQCADPLQDAQGTIQIHLVHTPK
jgi:hypothetical protein